MDAMMKEAKFPEHENLNMEQLLEQRVLAETGFKEVEKDIERREGLIMIRKNELLAYMAIDRDLAERIARFEALDELAKTLEDFDDIVK